MTTKQRQCQIGTDTVIEVYWAGDYPVYVNNRLVAGSYEEVCERLGGEHGIEANGKRRVLIGE